jgi:hypothetical protein
MVQTNTKLQPTKSDNYDKINERLNWLWYNTWSFNNKTAPKIESNSEKICNISLEKRGGHMLYMIRYDRFSDDKVFNDVVGGKFVPNEIGKKINLVKSGDFGSANEGFITLDVNLKLAIETLIKNGYEVGFTNII